ncbi:MAG TPA: hypothetical protein VKS79_03295 [Gemmataceae bacterium]|nr:hypothetical protein [Gemmataceae bacterium]
MNHVSLDDQHESVKQFVLGLTVDGGSVLELEGRAVACVVPPPVGANGSTSGQEWTDERNARRITLIQKKHAAGLNPEEIAELAVLQELMLRFRQKVAPLPLEDARKLHQELLARAMRHNGS